MKVLRKPMCLLFAAILLIMLSATAYAHDIPSFSESGRIISVAHGGNTMLYPKNSLAAVQSAFEEGADCVSVDIRKTADNAFVLSHSNELGDVSLEGRGMIISMLPLSQIITLHLTDKTGKPSEHFITDLNSALQAAIAYDKTLIIDGEWENRELIYQCICDNNATENALIRTSAPSKEAAGFISNTSGTCGVIGQYHGNILFGARSYITSMSKSGSKIIFLGTKNSFGVIFRNGVLSAFGKTGYSARAAMMTYNAKESGTRPDNEKTWSDIIDRGYSVIETDRISDLVAYINRTDSERASLASLVAQAKETEISYLTTQSRSDIESALNKAEWALSTLSSADSLSMAKSRLNLALNNKILADTQETGKEGVFSITLGKIFAVLIVTLVIVAVQMYCYYKQADKKMPPWLKNLLRK